MVETKNYFEGPDDIFANKGLLQIDHLPDSDRIIGRDDQLSSLATAMRPARLGDKPNNAFVYGKSGTGKSLCTKFLARQLVETASKNDVTVGFAYIDCLQDSTETQVVQAIGRALNDNDQTGEYFPAKGISTSEYYRRLWSVLDSLFDATLIVLDELDKLDDPNDVLMQLTRAGEAEKLERCELGVVGISNKARLKDHLEPRALSSLCDREFVFPPYDSEQLQHILRAREDAFRSGLLTDDVIPLAAALSAQEYGDARQAIDILRFAGELAEEDGEGNVDEHHVRQAHSHAEKNQLLEIIRELTAQSALVLHAVALLAKESSNGSSVKSSEAYTMYVQLSDEQGSRTLSQRRVRDLLGELEFLEIIEQHRRGAGRGAGSYMENHLIDDPKLVVEALDDATAMIASEQ